MIRKATLPGISRRVLLQTAAMGAAAAAIPSKPNILLIVTDQQSLDTISALGADSLRTPNMDRLVRRGMTFTNTYCTGAVCSPSRASIFTGRMPSEAGVENNSKPIREGIPNLGQLLSPNGYDTYYAGKWHLGTDCSWTVPGFDVIGVTQNGQGHYRDSSVSRACEAFLTSRRSARPFLLYAGYMQPHDICQFEALRRQGLTEDHRFAHIERELPSLPPNYRSVPSGERTEIAAVRRSKAKWDDRMWRVYCWAYERMVEQVDAEVGRLLDALESSGLHKNTLVIFTSDHGEGRARHGLVGKSVVYEEAVRVPTIVSWLGHIPENKVDRTTIVSGVDIVPTVCDYAGVSAGRQQGLSLRPALEGRSGPKHEFAVVECRVTTRALRTARFKYIETNGTNLVQLFDLENDPWEMTNLVDVAGHSSTIREHAQLLRDWERHIRPAPQAALKWN
jgi:choline-sulfatase